ncbi:MAG TPA: hypothetical protein VHR41_21080 [Gemmatimonadales bacterium]|jgi:hypothetical protein|nr:hypothetical protein [Gemmatimonadales bacterium]
MQHHRLLILAVAACAIASCNPFHQGQAVQVSAKDENLNSRWHANLATPANLAGAVQMNGSASMTPAKTAGNTTVSLDLANASPGGLHPWQLHRGQCGSDKGVVGSADAYPVAKVGGNGRATVTANLPYDTPTAGSYFVMVRASAGNDAVTVACGNLAPPTL